MSAKDYPDVTFHEPISEEQNCKQDVAKGG